MNNKIVIIGGGASGYFTAINAKENNPDLDITILEKGNSVLQKVKISGGGRCNITNACTEPKQLVEFYPRGYKELLGPFYQFNTQDTFNWFESRGVQLNIEKDGRVFPKANTSNAIIDCFQNLAKDLDIKVCINSNVKSFSHNGSSWIITTETHTFYADKLVIATGGAKNIWNLLKSIGHTIITPAPSLFTFNIKDSKLKDLSGISVPNATIKIINTKYESSGPLLITHWGLSGPAILKLSSFGARILFNQNYKYYVKINWLSKSKQDIFQILLNFKKKNPSKKVCIKFPFLEISNRLWKKFTFFSDINENQNWADLNLTQLENLTKELTHSLYQGDGMTTFKNEFVTAGGVSLKEINFKNYESKIHKNLFVVGEVLDIDAITGGFNFQNAWTSGFICSRALSKI